MVKRKVRGDCISRKVVAISTLVIVLLIIGSSVAITPASADTASPEIFVSTSPSGLNPQPTIDYEGLKITVTAQPVAGYVFQRWVDITDDVSMPTVSTSASYSFVASNNSYIRLEAVYLPAYIISVSTLPSDLNPQPTGGGTYPEGQAITVTAEPVTGYTFQGWAENGNPVSISASYQFTVTGDRSLVAEYSPTPYTISVSTSPPGLNPQPTGGGTYYYGDTATVTAQPVAGYVFQRWIEYVGDIEFPVKSIVSTSPSYSFDVTENRDLVAKYLPAYTVSVSTLPSGLEPQPTGAGTYPEGQIITVTAQTVTGYTFQGWTENGKRFSTDYSYSFNVTRERSLVAEYSPTPYTISVLTSPSSLNPQPTGGGTYPYNDTAKVIAQPVTGYTFQRWTENGKQLSTDASYSFTVTGNRTLTAEYSQNQYNISVSTSPSGLNPQPTGADTYSEGQIATVIAQSVAGYTFQRWTENGSIVFTDYSYSFNVTGNRSLVAEYSQNQYNISVSTSPSVLTQPTGGGTYPYNDTVKVTAQSVTGYTFQRWTENGEQVSTDTSYSFTVTGNRTLMAEYSKNTYTVSVTTSPAGLDSQPEGGGTYSFEDAVTVTAQPVTGYTFQRWTENGNQVSTDLRYSFKANGNRNLVAEYSKAAGPTVTIGPSPGVKGTEIIAGETKISSTPATKFDIILNPPILGFIIAIFAAIAAAGILKYLVLGAPKLKVDVEKLLQINIETSGGEILDKPELRHYKVNVDVKGGIAKYE